MAHLAIKGHATRGKEVIEILEMLGGKNKAYLNGTNIYCVYYICAEDYIDTLYAVSNAYIVFTLEDFLEKYPYKVGDKVYNIVHNENQTITDLAWDFQGDEVGYQTNNNEYVYVNYLQPCKEETMEENTDKALAPDLKGEDYFGKRFGYKIPNGYAFECVRNNEIILKPIKPKYPKTYVECAKILDCFGAAHIDGYKCELLDKLQELLICRDAYWKIAGEQMGLGKPWEPYWTIYKQKFCLGTDKDKVIEECVTTGNRILTFPTSEMRDAFYENFKELIEQCKEFL